MALDFAGQRNLAAENSGAVAVSGEINHVVGQDDVVLARPTPIAGRNEILVLIAQKGTWNVRVGTHLGTDDLPDTEDPVVSVENGTGALKLVQGEKWVLPSASSVTVTSYASDSVLTYWWA